MTLPAPGRSAPRRRVDRHDDRRDPGAQPGAAPLDDAGQDTQYELKVPAGTADDRQRAADGRPGRRPGVAEVVHGEEAARRCRRSRASCASAGRTWRRPTTCRRRRARRRRSEADGAARSDGADGGAHRSAGAGGRIARDCVADAGQLAGRSPRARSASRSSTDVKQRRHAASIARSSRRPSRRSRPGTAISRHA